MEEKNKQLADKNTKLKEELDKLQINQKRLLKENINAKFFSNIIHQKMLNMLDINLENIENALSNTLKMKDEIFPNFNNLTNTKEENLIEKNLLENKNNILKEKENNQSIIKKDNNTKKKRRKKYLLNMKRK